MLARDQHDPDGPLVRRRITRTYRRTAYHLQVLSVRDADGREQTIRVTDEHPFYVAGRGWTKARELSGGDVLLGAAGEASAVIGNLGEEHAEGVTVYNLEVEDAHSYFVRGEGADGEPVWVHNASYDLALKASLEEAEAAQYEGYTRGAASAIEIEGRVYTGRSTTADGGPLHPDVQAVYDTVPLELREDYHAGCAEGRAISAALEAGEDVRGARIITRVIGGEEHGQIMTPCNSCRIVLYYFGVKG